VKALEQSLLERLNEIVKALTKQYADKNDTRKALKLLEKNLKNMYDLFMSKANNDNEDDAMFTKKPLGGTSCASCTKDVIDMYGKRVDYHAWGKLPFRDPSERIARVGQGFSKMLSMINPDQLSQYNQAGFAGSSDGLHYDPNMAGQQQNMNRLPPSGKTMNNFNQ
jgi:protein subunit release factor A